MSDSERDRRLLEYLWQYRSALRRLIAHWTRPWDDIDEIEAELFHELWKTREQIPAPIPSPWVKKVVKFVSLKWISRENRQQGGKWLQGKDKRLVSVPLDDPNTDQLLDEHPDPESALITSERRRHLYTALAQLSPEVRAAWIAVNLEGKDKAAVATLARCSRTTIYGRIREADDFILTKLQVCALEGTVRDSQSKKRLAATVVATSVDDARGYSETTDHRSPFRFSGLSVGEYMLSGRAPSYQVSNEKVEIHLGLNFRDISLVRATSAPAGTEC